VHSVTYHPSGQIESFDYGNTSSLTHSFNARQQITDVFTIGTINPNPVQDHSYTYDAMGRVVWLCDHRRPQECALLPARCRSAIALRAMRVTPRPC
jgi:hypothetical protein